MNCLILLVGAAGFEPTTCSTQNCRATRLRYTPIITERRRYTLKARPARQVLADLAAIEERMPDAVAGLDAVFLGGPGDHLQYPFRGSAGRDDFGRQRFGVLGYSQDPAVRPDENHVERDVRVLHPHRDFLRGREVEQHALP